MRPKSIVWFDRTLLAAVALSIVNVLLSFDLMQSALANNPALGAGRLGIGFIISTLALSSVMMLLLWYFISRRASVIAKWIYTVIFAIGMLGMPGAMTNASEMNRFGAFPTIALTLLQLASVVCLFLPDAREWFARRGKSSYDTEAFK